jgi:MFS transporter, putative metabolite:H+ symporter
MIVFHHRLAFWAGVLAVSVGVALHLPMYVMSSEMHYHMAGMPMDFSMVAGMVLIVVGLGLSAFGLIPRRPTAAEAGANLRVRAMDDAPIKKAHVALLVVMAAAVTIDVMKPTTLAFVLPGMTMEYGLRSPLNPSGSIPAAVFPFCALIGMVTGSFVWGVLGDRIGRRASILLAGVLFIATSICGSMPSFYLNLFMCFLMGVAVGGMLPIAFALLAETIPARHRGWLMVLIGGDVAGAYVLTSYLSSVLEPRFSWRILWLIGLPTGILLILLNRWIPESPRFLLATGRIAEATAVMKRFGAEIVTATQTAEDRVSQLQTRFGHLFRHPLGGLTVGVALFGVGWGLVNNGFLLWLPTNLRQLGMDIGAADRLLANSALIGFPVIFVVALLYGFWSSKRTMVAAAIVVAGALIAFTVLGERVGENRVLLQVLIVALLAGTSAMLAMLTPYSSEVYPTRIRARGTGLAGMAGRMGGFLGVGVVLAGLAPPTIRGAALVGAIPIALAVLAVVRYGIETRRRRLEEITAAELGQPT